MRVGDVVIGRGLHDWGLGIATWVHPSDEHRFSVWYLLLGGGVGVADYAPWQAEPKPRRQALGHKQRAIVNAAIAAEALRRIG